MALIALPLVKNHLRVSHDDEDAVIGAYQAAAEEAVTEYLNRPLYPEGAEMPSEDDEDHDEYQMIVTPSITAAILLLVGEIFDVRNPDPALAGDAALPRAVRALLAPHRVWRLEPEDSV